MKMRVVVPLVLCGLALLVVNPGAARSGGSGVAAEPPTELLVQPEPDPLSEIITRLSDPHWNQRFTHPDRDERRKAYFEVQGLLDRLGSFRGNPLAIRELIRWMEFSTLEFLLPPEDGTHSDRLAFQARQKRVWRIDVTEPTIPHPVQDYPAVRALLRMGPTVAPYLVDEYVTTFVGRKNPEIPHPRLGHIVLIHMCDRNLARPAVLYALGRMADERDELARQGYRLFIDRVVAGFPYERAKLFPPEALRK